MVTILDRPRLAGYLRAHIDSHHGDDIPLPNAEEEAIRRIKVFDARLKRANPKRQIKPKDEWSLEKFKASSSASVRKKLTADQQAEATKAFTKFLSETTKVIGDSVQVPVSLAAELIYNTCVKMKQKNITKEERRRNIAIQLGSLLAITNEEMDRLNKLAGDLA